jgi:hypothetical protein
MLKVVTEVSAQIPVFCIVIVYSLVDLVTIYQITWHHIQDCTNFHMHATIRTSIYTESQSLQVPKNNKQQLSRACRADILVAMCGRDNSMQNCCCDNEKEMLFDNVP